MLLRPMTASDEITGTWTAVPGYFCEVTSRGQARSVDRVLGNGRRVKGSPLSVTLSNRGYVLVKVYDHDGVRQTRTMHSLMMAAFEPGRPPGTEIRHWNDIGDDNRRAPGGEAACRAGLGHPEYGTPKPNSQASQRNAPAPLVALPIPPPRAPAYFPPRLRRWSR